MQRWNKEKLAKLRNYYAQLAYNDDDIKSSLENEETLYSIENIIYENRLFNLPNISRIKFGDVVDSDLEIINKYGYYCPIIRDVQPLCDKYSIPNITLKKIDYIALFFDTDNFYNSFDNTITMSFNYIKKTFPTNFRLYKLSKNNSCCGETYPLLNTDESYYSVGINHTLQDLVSMIHEVEHGINNSLNTNIMLDSEKYCFLEADAIFMEMLGNDFAGNLYNKDEALKIKITTLKDYLYSVGIINQKMDLYNELTGSKLYSKKYVNSMLKEMGYDSVYIKDITSSYIRELFHYIISYLTAIELYILYQEDKEFALIKMMKIRDVKYLDNKGYLEFVKSININPGEHFQEYINQLLEIDKDKKLIWKKDIQ